MTDKTKPEYWFNVQANAIKSDGSTCGEISGCTYTITLSTGLLKLQ